MSIKIHETLAQIKEAGLNKFRCCLTGAPYATIEDSEIIIALESQLAIDANVSIGNLIDSWQLKALAFNTKPLPSLMGSSESKLVHTLKGGAIGNAKLMTYFLTRLLYPHLGSEPMATDKAKARMLFAIDCYESAVVEDSMKVGGFVQQLAVVDSYLAMPQWHRLWLFESTFSQVGIEKAPAHIKRAFNDPSTLIGNPKAVESVIGFMYQLMLHCAERDGAAGKSGNRLAQQIMFLSATMLPPVVIPHFQKTLSEADRIRIENRNRINNKAELRIAHSAINGKKYLPGQMTSVVDKMAKELADKLAANRKPKAEAKPKKASNVNPLMAAAFASLNIKLPGQE